MWSVISDPNGGYVQGINQGNAQGTIQLQDTNMAMQNINTMQGIAQSSVQGLVQQQKQNVGNMQQQQQQQPQIVGSVQDTIQGLMGNAQGIVPQQIGNMQGMTQGILGNVQGTIQNMGTGLIQQQGYSQGIQLGQSIANTPYAQGNPQIAGAVAGMGDQQLFQQIKQMSASNPMMLMALQEFENRMLTNMTPLQGLAGVSPGYNCQGLIYNNVQPQGIQQLQPQGIQQVPPQGMSQFQQLGQYQIQPQVQQMVQPQVQQMVPQYFQQPMQQPVIQSSAVQPVVQQVTQTVVQSSVQPSVVQQPVQNVVQQPVQPAVQLPVQPFVMQQPVQQPTVQQPVLQSLVQQPMQQPVMQQSVVQQPSLQQLVQQPIVQQPIQQQVVQLQQQVMQQPVMQQPMQPLVQLQMQQQPVSNQGILQEQNQVISQNQYQGILQVCNQGIPHVPNQGTLQCPIQDLQPNQSQGLQPSENQVTLQSLNQVLQLGSQDAEMQPVQGYLGMALCWNQGNHQQSQINIEQPEQEDPGVQKHIPEVKSSLYEPSADHSNNQLDECKQADNLCGQHETAVGSYEKTEVQDQFDQHDKPLIIQVTSTQTVQTLLPESASAMLLMADVPEQTWQPLMPSSASQSYGNQSLPTESIKCLPQEGDCHASQGEVSSGDHHIESDEVSKHLNNITNPHEELPSIVNVVSCNGTSQYVDDLDAQSTKCMGDLLGNQHETDKNMTSDDHYIYQNDATTPNSSVVVTTADMNRMQQILHMTGEYMPSHFTCLSSPIWKNDDVDQLEQTWKLGLMHCQRNIVREYDQWGTQQRDMVTVTKFRPPDLYNPCLLLEKPGWCWRDGVPWTCIHNPQEMCQECLLWETKFKPPDMCLSIANRQETEEECRLSWLSVPKISSEIPVCLPNIGEFSLMDETRFKPPGSVLEETKWHWCDGVPWMCSGNPHDSQNGSPCHKYLEVETKYRPPDTTCM